MVGFVEEPTAVGAVSPAPEQLTTVLAFWAWEMPTKAVPITANPKSLVLKFDIASP
jgi:hypothetical protein